MSLVPSPKLYSSCSSIFNTESQLYNVTIEWRVTPNDCSVLGRITVFVLKMLPYETVFGLTSTLDTTQVQAEIKLVRIGINHKLYVYASLGQYIACSISIYLQ